MLTKKLQLTTRLNIYLVCIVSLLMFSVTAYTQWVALAEDKQANTAQLKVITEYLVQKMPAASFAEIAERQGAAGTSVQEQVLNAYLGGFMALLAVIMLFQEFFSKLKKDLTLFAEQFVKGRADQVESELPELTPMLHYISEQTERMARLDRLNMVGEMAAGIGHEVRNPMTTVRGYLQYMSTKEQCKSYKEQLLLINVLPRTITTTGLNPCNAEIKASCQLAVGIDYFN